MIDLTALNEVFIMVFQNSDIKVTKTTTADDIDGWDSLSHVLLITALEDHFHISFSQREIIKFRNVGDMLECINNKMD